MHLRTESSSVDSGSWPATGTGTELTVSVSPPVFGSGLEPEISLTGGGFWVEGLISGSGSGQPLPVAVAMNGPDPNTPGNWTVSVTLYPDLVAEQGLAAYDGWRLHATALYYVDLSDD